MSNLPSPPVFQYVRLLFRDPTRRAGDGAKARLSLLYLEQTREIISQLQDAHIVSQRDHERRCGNPMFYTTPFEQNLLSLLRSFF